MANIIDSQRQELHVNAKTAPLIRTLDLFASGVGLLLLAPVFLIVGLAIKFSSPGPAFFRASRVGQDGQIFKLYKFRSMYLDADRKGPAVTVRDDPRVTLVGRRLRRTKLDELPQLINVFIGEMSLVGPRPEDPQFVAHYTPRQRQVLAVRPGITSPASLRYRDEEDLLAGEDWEKTYREQVLPHKLDLDLAYLHQRTVWTDLSLILQTVARLVLPPEAVSHESANAEEHVILPDNRSWSER
jgi:lipopolysaccharide/colanic/teichoic acid biosynthesis glycosyltransferase